MFDATVILSRLRGLQRRISGSMPAYFLTDSFFMLIRRCFRCRRTVALVLLASFALVLFFAFHFLSEDDDCRIPMDKSYIRRQLFDGSRNGKSSLFQMPSDDYFQPVDDNRSFVYSAYIDDRPAPDVDFRELPVIRILAAIRRDEVRNARKRFRCIFWYEDADWPVATHVIRITDMNKFDHKMPMMACIVLCNLPTTDQGVPPMGVSLVSRICNSPLNYLPLNDLRIRRRNFEASFENVSFTRESKNRSTVSNFTVCVPPIFGGNMTVMEFVEFIELNRLLGADRFLFYLESPSSEIELCIRSYSKLGFVEFYRWNFNEKLNGLHYHGQIIAQNDCLYRVMYRSSYLTIQDLDEFIVPTRTTNWRNMLDLIHEDLRLSESNRTASYCFRNLFFPMKANTDLTLNLTSPVDGQLSLKTLTKTVSLNYIQPWKERSKVMARPERVFLWHVHEMLDESLVRKTDENVMVDEEDGLLYHYRSMDLNESACGCYRNRRMWKFSRQLMAKVMKSTTSVCKSLPPAPNHHHQFIIK